jgi:superfamily II DNA/RNA helicase
MYSETNEPIIKNWEDFNLEPNILRGIYSYGFEKPSIIQSKAILPIIEGRDIIAQAQSGTGKTATFSIGSLSRVDITQKYIQVLIMSPTHELSIQITSVIKSLSSMMNGINIYTLIGGSSVNTNITDIRNNIPHIIVGCPGRVYDLVKRNEININKLRLIVLDEADEMLSYGFKEQIYNIFQYIGNDTQVALFSATLPSHIYSITDKFMREPLLINVAPEFLTLEGIKQYYVALNNDLDKYNTLKDLYQFISVSQCIIYCNSIKRVIDLYDAMNEDNFPVTMIHSNMDKLEREHSFAKFRTGEYRVLVSSNVTARGIDIQQVSVVINFDIPKDIHTYIHRIGRSGRWGRKGVGINFITRRDISKLRDIESYYSCQIDELPNNLVV